ncbi:MAG: lipopolysaccharide transport periplasmic protein LptA [Deltaproteobacteria bacterium]|nr:lipopolysaccharide transport periplasmic protein LptA [Deltaproteobacteria bacterium]
MNMLLLSIQRYFDDNRCGHTRISRKAAPCKLSVLFLFAIMVSFMVVLSAHAGSLIEEVQQPGKQTKPIDITSSQLEANLKTHIVIFKGNVVAKQGDVVLYCDTLTAYYDAKDKNITMIVATGDVKITKKDMIATGDEAVFDNVKKLLTLTGSPRIWQAKNIIEGTKIVFYLGTDRIFVEGAKSLYNPQTEGILHGQTP